MAISVLSAITVPTPRDGSSYSTDAATRGYVDSNSGGGGGSVSDATTTAAGIVMLASNTGTAADNGKVPVLGDDENGRLSENVLPSNIVTSDKIFPHNTLYLNYLTAGNSQTLYIEDIVSSAYSSKNGWYVMIPSTKNPTTLVFDPTFNTSSLDFLRYCCTFEIIISCGGTAGSTFNFSIIDGNDEPVLFLGDSITSLERGYTYFLVARNFRTLDSSNTSTRQWIFNLQGRVPVPVAS